MFGNTGGPLLGVVAMIREATAETGILYGAEFRGGNSDGHFGHCNAQEFSDCEKYSRLEGIGGERGRIVRARMDRW